MTATEKKGKKEIRKDVAGQVDIPEEKGTKRM